MNKMKHVEKIKIVNKTYSGTHVLKKGFEINCESINLFVGNQGCGKSTMLDLLQKAHSDLDLTFSDNVRLNGIKTFYFDSEKMNPRVTDPQMYTRPNGENVGIGFGGALGSRFRSHGEVLQDFIFEPLKTAKNSVILLDEPESGLSITNQLKLIKAINHAVNNNCQLFIATHCYPLIEQFNVISLEHKKQMKGIDFINLIKNQSIKDE
jgi:predicted ATPase